MGRLSGAGARAVDRASSITLWRQIHDDLIRRVERGEFADEFPGELALVSQYGVSRATVREALRRLRSKGIVSGERGRTSRLTDPAEISQATGTLSSLFTSVRGTGQEQHNIVRRLDIRADGVVADRLNLEGSVPLIYLERVRMAGDRPLALDRSWLPASLAAQLMEVDFTETSLYGQLEKRCRIHLTGGEEVIRAVVPTAVERTLLDISASTAALTIERIAYAGTQAIEWRHTLIRGDRFALNTSFAGDEGVRLATAQHR